MSAIAIQGHAIVSADDRIATADGAMPACLMNDADWALFQAELDRAALCVLGRLGHVAHPNSRNRPRLVISSSVAGLERRDDGWWWNPAGASWTDILPSVLPHGGIVAVPGGQRVFDLFLEIGYDAFHLSRVARARIPDGRPVFSACDETTFADPDGIAGRDEGGRSAASASRRSADDILAKAGLVAGDRQIIDAEQDVVLTIWQRGNPPSVQTAGRAAGSDIPRR